jgi:hypothetical protein
VNRRFGEVGNKLAEGTMVCCFSRKKSRKDCLTSKAVFNVKILLILRGLCSYESRAKCLDAAGMMSAGAGCVVQE